MKNSTLAFLTFVLLFSGFQLKADEMILKGVYQGKDLYIINPMLDIGEEYCAFEVTVNNTKFEDIINSSAFRITLDYVGLQFGQEYEVVIKHHDNCAPKLVNPEVLKPLCTYEIASQEIGYDNILKFTTNNESGKLVFYVEEFRWGKWLEVGRLPGEGGPGSRSYAQKVYPYAGENKYRIYQIDHLGRKFYSAEMLFTVEKEAVTVTTPLNKVSKEIILSAYTRFTVVNEFGEELISGTGDVVDVSNLKKGEYFLNFENEYVVFKKK
jgi:hypothetical protein